MNVTMFLPTIIQCLFCNAPVKCWIVFTMLNSGCPNRTSLIFILPNHLISFSSCYCYVEIVDFLVTLQNGSVVYHFENCCFISVFYSLLVAWPISSELFVQLAMIVKQKLLRDQRRAIVPITSELASSTLGEFSSARNPTLTILGRCTKHICL